MPKVKGAKRAKLKKRMAKIKNMERNNLPKGERYMAKFGDREIAVTSSLKDLRKVDRKITAKVNKEKREAFAGGKEKKNEK